MRLDYAEQHKSTTYTTRPPPLDILSLTETQGYHKSTQSSVIEKNYYNSLHRTSANKKKRYKTDWLKFNLNDEISFLSKLRDVLVYYSFAIISE